MDERIWVNIENVWTIASTSVTGVVIITYISTWTKDELLSVFGT